MARMKTNGGTARKYTGTEEGKKSTRGSGKRKDDAKWKEERERLDATLACSLKAWNAVLRLNDRPRYRDKTKKGGKLGTAGMDILFKFDIFRGTTFTRNIDNAEYSRPQYSRCANVNDDIIKLKGEKFQKNVY